MSKKDGGPAFPVPSIRDAVGMTLRDYFAAKAMQSFMQGAVLPPGFDASDSIAFACSRAYEVADAMLAAREVKP